MIEHPFVRQCAGTACNSGSLGGRQSIYDLTSAHGRLTRQRDVTWEKLNEIPGVSCVKPKGALYAFRYPR